MTTDIATLGFKSETDDLVKAEDRLDDVTEAAERTDDATEKLGRQTKKTNSRFRQWASGGESLRGTLRGVANGIGRVAGSLTGMIAAGAAVFTLSGMVEGARETSAAVAELSTLLPTGSAELSKMRLAAKGMANEFGTNASAQLKSFYGAVSAGAADAADAIDVVSASNKLAIGGLTDTARAVDVLTTATNAYASTGLKASSASDALFVGMRAGKTTIGELASGLGNVIPIAASLGVEFDELVAGTSALTLQGLSTASAITSLRAILSGIAKPTSQASKLSKQLGLDFSTTALRSKGLAGFLTDVIDKTNGSADQLSVLFGSVEALNAALAFAGSGGEAFNSILGEMENKAGATGEAFDKVAGSLDQRWNVVLSKIGNAADQLGNKFLSVLVPAAEGVLALASNGDVLNTSLEVMTVLLAGLAATQLPAVLGLLGTVATAVVSLTTYTKALNIALGVTRAAMTALGGPIGVVLGLLGSAAAAWTVFGGKLRSAEDATYDAADANLALSRQLVAFEERVAPFAADAVIEVANANRKLAASAYEAAKAELEKTRALQAQYMENGPHFTQLAVAPGEKSLDQINREAFDNRIIKQIEALTKAEADLHQADVALYGSSRIVSDEMRKLEDVVRPTTEAVNELGEVSTGAFDKVTSEAVKAGDQIKDALHDSLYEVRDALFDMMWEGEANFEDFGKSFVKTLWDMAYEAWIVKPMFDWIGNIGKGSGGGGGSGWLGDLFGSLLGFAKGGAFGPSGVQAFAKGDAFSNSIVKQPTMFAFAKGGALGVMGEAGEEAIMPLTRGPDGSLGVTAHNSNQPPMMINNNVDINVVNETNAEVEVSQRDDGVIDMRIRKVIANDIKNGGQVGQAIRSTYQVKNNIMGR